MRNWFAWLLAAFGFVAVSVFVIAQYGMRDDFQLAMQNGTLIWKNGSLILSVLVAAITTIALSRPNTTPKRRFIVMAILALLAVLSWRLIELSRHNSLSYEITHVNFGGAGVCVPIIIFGGIAVFVVVWQFWLRKAASQSPKILGAAAGILSASIAASAYAFHCNMDNIFYFIFVYWLPIIGFGLFGYLMGEKLKW